MILGVVAVHETLLIPQTQVKPLTACGATCDNAHVISQGTNNITLEAAVGNVIESVMKQLEACIRR